MLLAGYIAGALQYFLLIGGIAAILSSYFAQASDERYARKIFFVGVALMILGGITHGFANYQAEARLNDRNSRITKTIVKTVTIRKNVPVYKDTGAPPKVVVKWRDRWHFKTIVSSYELAYSNALKLCVGDGNNIRNLSTDDQKQCHDQAKQIAERAYPRAPEKPSFEAIMKECNGRFRVDSQEQRTERIKVCGDVAARILQ